MICYVSYSFDGEKSNIEKAKKITRDLQKKDLSNCYICPLIVFSHIEYGDMDYDDEMELFLDILQNCDKLIVASDDISKNVQMEIDFAKLVKMEVVKFDKNGELRPFTE